MTTGAISRMLAAVACAGLLAGDALPAQQQEPGARGGQWAPGLVLNEVGGWRVPTPGEALRALRGDPSLLGDPDPDVHPVIEVLRQVHAPQPRAEQEALVEALVDILLIDAEFSSNEYRVQSKAYAALAMAMDPDFGRGGMPYPEAFDALVRVYETRAARLLADGGDDPFREAYRTGPSLAADGLGGALSEVYRADPEGRGRDYVRAMFEASEPLPPPVCRRGLVPLVMGPDGEITASSKEGHEAWLALPECPKPYNPSVWCEAGRFLMYEPGATRPHRPDDVAEPPDPEVFKELCFPGIM